MRTTARTALARLAAPALAAALVLVLAGLGLRGAPARAQGEPGPGRVVYRTYCASCHGVDGRGSGPVAPTLRTEPADLTRLHEEYGTPLDRERLMAVIDGRTEVQAHGPREMPVWGMRFFEDMHLPEGTAEASKRATLLRLVEYLESLQTVRNTSG